MDVNVEGIGVCKKRLTITIPREEIEQKFRERFDELEKESLVPGFRPGHAPRRLVEKRFHRAVSEEVRVGLATDGLTKALEQEKLEVLGDPEFDPAKIELPEDGPMTFSVDLEVRPEFELPDYTAVSVQVERDEVADQDVDAALDRLREANAELRPLAAMEEAKAGDMLTADLAIAVGEEKVVDRRDVRLPVRAIAVEGIALEKFPQLVEGAKAGEDRSETITVGEQSRREDLRGKEARVTVTVKEIQRPEPPAEPVLLERTGYESLEGLRTGLRRQLEAEAEEAHAGRQREAVEQWLLDRTQMELPADLAARYADRVTRREMVNLLYRGLPADEIEKHEQEIRSASVERSVRDLKLYFILDAIAKKEGVEAADAEVDARVRYIAARYGRRDDRVREEMESRGTLDSLRSQIRDDKVMRLLLDKAAGAEAGERAAPEAAAQESQAEEKPEAPGEAAAPETEST